MIKTVVTNGCFDILHVGHLKLLEECKKLGDYLIVLINSDESIRRLKGNTRPINCLLDRKLMLESIKWVDEVIVFEEDTPLNAIMQLKPTILVKGGDYDIMNIVGSDYVRSYGGIVMTVPLVDGKSTTNILKHIERLS